MNKFDRFLHKLNIVLGCLSLCIFFFGLFVFLNLQPKMKSFESITRLEQTLLTGVGLGLLIILGYFLLSLLQIVRAVRDADQVFGFHLILIILGVICMLFVFSDIALLSDISKQYQHGLEQPEWILLFPMMTIQFLYTLVLTYLHMSGYFIQKNTLRAARDINIFLVVHFVGVVCGLMGLGLSSLGFFFAQAWSLPVHTAMSGSILVFPYVLAVLYWGVLKLREKNRVWWDEKQTQDVGKSALVTMALVSLLMLSLFAFNFQNLGGVIRMLWLPFYIFGTITFFSGGNLFFASRG